MIDLMCFNAFKSILSLSETVFVYVILPRMVIPRATSSSVDLVLNKMKSLTSIKNDATFKFQKNALISTAHICK